MARKGQGRKSSARKGTSGKPRTKKTSSSGSKRFRFAVVGCGGMGQYHMPRMLDIPELEIVALCDIVKTKMRDCQKRFFGPAKLEPAQYADYDQMLSREKLDAVLLVTPHTTHYPQARAALKAGINVLSEKPMVTGSEEARDLVALADERGLRLGVAFQSASSGEFAYIKNLIRRGDLGGLQVIDVRVAQPWKRLASGTWRADPKHSGGGQLYDSGAHMLNAMIYLVDSPVKRVFALTDNRGMRVDIDGTASVLFENGCLGSISCAGNATVGMDSGVTLYAEKGTIKTGIYGEKLEHFDEQGERVKYPYVPYATVSPVRNFVDALMGNDDVRCPGRYGVLLAELMDAIYESAETGQPVDVKHRMRPAG